MSAWFRVLVGLLFLFLLAPLLVVLLTSFSNDAYLAFPPQEWGFAGYRAALNNPAFQRGLVTSLVIAGAATGIALIAGTAAAFALARFAFPGRAALLALFTAPLLVPAIILGLGLLLVFARLGLLATYPGLILGHLLVAQPFVVRVVLTAVRGIPPPLEEAAATLGASPWRVFARVTLPLMIPGMLAAAILAFLASFDEVVISLFLVGPRLTTLPIAIYQTVQYQADPQISALSVLLVAITATLVVIVERSFGFLTALGR